MSLVPFTFGALVSRATQQKKPLGGSTALDDDPFDVFRSLTETPEPPPAPTIGTTRANAATSQKDIEDLVGEADPFHEFMRLTGADLTGAADETDTTAAPPAAAPILRPRTVAPLPPSGYMPTPAARLGSTPEPPPPPPVAPPRPAAFTAQAPGALNLSPEPPAPFDDSGMTEPFVAPWTRVAAQFPAASAKVPGIRVNPNLKTSKLWAQIAPDGYLEINPDAAGRKDLDTILAHEIAHAGGADEAAATAFETAAAPATAPTAADVARLQKVFEDKVRVFKQTPKSNADAWTGAGIAMEMARADVNQATTAFHKAAMPAAEPPPPTPPVLPFTDRWLTGLKNIEDIPTGLMQDAGKAAAKGFNAAKTALKKKTDTNFFRWLSGEDVPEPEPETTPRTPTAPSGPGTGGGLASLVFGARGPAQAPPVAPPASRPAQPQAPLPASGFMPPQTMPSPMAPPAVAPAPPPTGAGLAGLVFGDTARGFGARVADAISVTPPASPPEALARAVVENPTVRAVGRRAADIGLSVLAGEWDIPKIAIGYGNILTAGEVGKIAKSWGVDPEEAARVILSAYSPEQLQALKNVDNAQGFVGASLALWGNPSVTVQNSVRSLPAMLLGGAIGARLAAAGLTSVEVGAAIGEGGIQFGQAASESGGDTPEKVRYAVASGALDAIIASVSGHVATAMGFDDIDTMLATGRRNPVVRGNVAANIVKAMAQEGLLEEMTQGTQEKIFENLSNGKPWDTDLGREAAINLFAGAAMGGVANVQMPARPSAAPTSGPPPQRFERAPETAPGAVPPVVPPSPGPVVPGVGAPPASPAAGVSPASVPPAGPGANEADPIAVFQDLTGPLEPPAEGPEVPAVPTPPPVGPQTPPVGTKPVEEMTEEEFAQAMAAKAEARRAAKAAAAAQPPAVEGAELGSPVPTGESPVPTPPAAPQPLRGYHGSGEIARRGTFEKFQLDIAPNGQARTVGDTVDSMGTWWTSSRADAEHYGRYYGEDGKTLQPGAVVEGDVALTNPRVFESPQAFYQFVDGFRTQTETGRAAAKGSAVRAALEAQGHDGLIVKSGGQGDAAPEGGDFYLSFENKGVTVGKAHFTEKAKAPESKPAEPQVAAPPTTEAPPAPDTTDIATAPAADFAFGGRLANEFARLTKKGATDRAILKTGGTEGLLRAREIRREMERRQEAQRQQDEKTRAESQAADTEGGNDWFETAAEAGFPEAAAGDLLNFTPDRAWVDARSDKALHGLLEAYDNLEGDLPSKHQAFYRQIERVLKTREGQQELALETPASKPAESQPTNRDERWRAIRLKAQQLGTDISRLDTIEQAAAHIAAAADMAHKGDGTVFAVGDRVRFTDDADHETYIVKGIHPNGIRVEHEGEPGVGKAVSPANIERAPHPTTKAVAKGRVRLYRGESDAATAGGRWFSPNIETARGYAEFGHGPKTITYVDVPQTYYNEMMEEGRIDRDAKPGEKVFVDEATAARARLFTAPPKVEAPTSPQSKPAAPVKAETPATEPARKPETQKKLTELEEKAAKAKADRDAAKQRLADILKNQTNVGMDPKALVEVGKILRSYVTEGTASFEAATLRFREDYGEPFLRQIAEYWEAGWDLLKNEDQSVEDVLTRNPQGRKVEGEQTDEERPLASGEAGEPEPERLGGRRTSDEGEPTGTGPGPETGPEPGPSEGDRQPGAAHTQQHRDPSLSAPLYHITAADAIGTGSVKQRVANNLAAIQTIKQIQEENRLATPDEQKVLVKYVGWGGLARIFEYWKENTDTEYWLKQYETLHGLLTEEEFARARNSTQNAHYTAPDIIQAIWAAVQHLGVTKGSILEPSAGIGHFVGLAPGSLREHAQFALVEKDPITAAIAKALYPSTYVQATGFEDANLPSNHFTAAVSNVPFGDIPITDRRFKGPPFMRAQIHNYFFGRALDRVAPGGLVAFVTSHGTMDSRENTKVRAYLASRADFLGAIRLPHTAFEGNAGTSVVTDIVFLRRRHEGAPVAHVAPWTETVAQSFPDRTGAPVEQHVNEYYLAHPEMVMGTHASTGKMYGGNTNYNVAPTGARADLAGQVAAAVARLPANAIDLKPPTKTLAEFETTRPPLGTRPFEYLVHEGRLAQVVDGAVTPIEMSKADETRIRAMLPIRASLRTLYDLMADGATDEAVTAEQKVLTGAYDKFVKKHGYLSSEDNWKAFREDPDLPLLLSLEDYDSERETATKTAVFTQRTMAAVRRERRAQNVGHALQLSLGETGTINLDRIAELLGGTVAQAEEALRVDGLAIETPEGWQLPAKLLSGNVRQKLLEMEAAAILDPKFQAAVEALKGAQPVDIPSHMIQVRLGASWISPQMVSDFVRNITDTRGKIGWTITYNPFDARWNVEGQSTKHSSRFDTPDVDTKTLLLAALNDRRLVVRIPATKTTPSRVNAEATALARQRRDELNTAFVEWLFNDDRDRRTWAVRAYNDRFNAYKTPAPDGSYLTFPGMSPYWRDKMRTHQRNAVARTLQFGNSLYAHVVGAGKTLAMVAAGMELRRLGLARKPMYVVPNHLIAQWPSEFLQYYPNAKVLVARPEDFTAENRQRFTARIAAGDWDAVIIAYTQFARVSMSPEAEAAYHRSVLDEVEAAILDAIRAEREQTGAGGKRKGSGRKSPQVKQLEKMRDKIQAKLDKLADRPKDDLLTFEQLGVDALFVDEAQGFKNLYFPTRQTNVAGVPSDNDTQRATDLYLKVRHINRLSGNRNVVLATGTPVSNSMAEIFVMQKLLQEHVLEAADINSFDAWLAQFGDIKVKTELDPSGTGLAPRPRLSEFRNLPDLSAMFRQVTDVQMIDDLPELKQARPAVEGDEPEIVPVPATQRQLDYLTALDDRAEHLDPRDRRSDNMAKITMDGRLSALDMRLIDRRLPDDEGTKLHVLADKIAEIWKENDHRKGTQVVFMDSGTPGAEERSNRPRKMMDDQGNVVMRPPTEAEVHRGLDLYSDLKDKLVLRGVPANQIAFIHDVDNVPPKKRDAALKSLFKKVRTGEIRVLIGSSPRMGTGMNVQDLLVAEHNADPTYKPSDTEQRYGRILRQGNRFFNADPKFRVRILNYVTTGAGQQFGFDAYMWQLNEAKAKFIADFFKGNVTQRSASLDLDQTVLTAGQMKAVATGNPLIIRQAELQGEAERLSLVKRGWEEARREASWNQHDYAERVAKHADVVARQEALKELLEPHDEGTPYTATIDGKEVVGHEAIGTAIIKAIQRVNRSEEPMWRSWNPRTVIGTYRGLEIELGGKDLPTVTLRAPATPKRTPDAPSRRSDWTVVTPAAFKKNALVDPAWRDPASMMKSIETAFDHLGAGEHQWSKGWDEENRQKLAQFEQILGSQFSQQAELDRVVSQLEEVDRALGMTGTQQPVEEVTTGDEGDEETGEESGGTPSGEASVGRYAEGSIADTWGRTGRDRVQAKTDIEDNPLANAPAVPRGTVGFIQDVADDLIWVDFGDQYGTVPVEEHEVTWAPARTPGAPSGVASEGEVAPKQAPRPSALRGFQFPELVDLARDLLGGQVPRVVKQFMGRPKLGMFRAFEGVGIGTIELHAGLFKRGNEHQVAAVLAHEIGHLVDWLPDYTLKRGNLLGRLRSMQSFLKWTYTSTDGATIRNPVVKAELLKVSKAWRPWEEGKDARFDSYRKSAKELYADALSVLLNDPGYLEEHAPTFYKEFFAELDKKSDVKAAYFDLQAVLAGSPEEITARRMAADRAMFQLGDTKALDLERLRQQERAAERKDLWFRLRVQLIDKHLPFVTRVANLAKRGITVAPEENPAYMLSERNYLGGKIKGFVEAEIQPIYDTLNTAGVSWETFGLALLYERVLNGDRPDMANPRGLTPADAQERHDALFAAMTSAQGDAVRTSLVAFRKAVKGVATEAFNVGLYSDDQFRRIHKNQAYATFQVIDYIEKGVSSRLHTQIGTLKDIVNPADATLLKALVTMRAIEHQKVKVGAFDFLHRYYPEDIAQATEIHGTRGMQPVEPPRNSGKQLVTYFDKGRYRGKYVDSYIADSLNNASIGQNLAVARILREINSRTFRPLFTTINLGFQSFNVRRDFWRFWKNQPTMTLGRALARYWEAAPVARMRAFGLPNEESSRIRQLTRTLTGAPPTSPTAAEQQAHADVVAAERAGILSITYNDFGKGRESEETQIEDIFARQGVNSRAQNQNLFKATLDWIEKLGNFIETLPKAAGIYELKGAGTIADLPADKRAFIREKIGSPDFLAGGTAKPIFNEVFLFSNAIMQGWRSDIRVATDPTTRSGFLWKTAALAILPKMIMAAALYGMWPGGDGGDDDRDLFQRLMSRVTEYDLTNYIVIPLGEDDKGQTVYWRQPLDETDRFIGGLVWKILRLAGGDKQVLDTMAQVVDYTAGQLPAFTPALSTIGDVGQYLAFGNIYDAFRGQFVLTDDEAAAGGSRALKKIAKWEFQQLGGGILWKFYPGDQTPRERTMGQVILDAPVISNIIGRDLRVTNYGELERLRTVKKATLKGEAARRLDIRSEVNAAVNRYQQLPDSQQTLAMQRQMAHAIANKFYPDKATREKKVRGLEQQMSLAVVRGSADSMTEAVIEASTVEQKVQTVLEIKKTLAPAAYARWLTIATQQHVISPAVLVELKKHTVH